MKIGKQVFIGLTSPHCTEKKKSFQQIYLKTIQKKITFKYFQVFGSRSHPFRFCHISAKTVIIGVSVLLLMFILGERTVHISWFSSCWIAWRLIHTAHSPRGLALSLCNKQSTDRTTKICQDNGTTASENPCKKQQRGSLQNQKSLVKCWISCRGYSPGGKSRDSGNGS